MIDDKQIQALVAAGLEANTLLPDTPEYETCLGTWWALNSRLRASCIVQPSSSEQVSAIMKALSAAGTGQFAVRSGGHAPWAGGSNVENGVTIDLTHVHSEAKYDPVTKIASLGPGQRWGDVVEQLAKQGVAVAGGRDADVGVGGLITGGGISYHSGRRGLVCDNLVNVEVVLADGTIVNANETSYSDLFKAIKGGKSNVGIATRFDLTTFEYVEPWGGLRLVEYQYADDCADHLVSFTEKYHEHPEAVFLVGFVYGTAGVSALKAMQLYVDTDGKGNLPILQKPLELPAMVHDIRPRPMKAMISDYMMPSGSHNTWITLTFKNDARVIKKSSQLFQAMIDKIDANISPDGFTGGLLWQPLPKLFLEKSQSKGGNVLGLDHMDDDLLIYLFFARVKTVEQHDFAHKQGHAMTAELQSYAESIGVSHPWIYINYANPSQNPLKSYGDNNVEFLKTISQKYDPEQIFQRLASGSFKVSTC